MAGRLPWILGASVLTIVAMLLAAGLVIAMRPVLRRRVVTALLSYAVGTLMAAAFLALLPHALEDVEARTVLGVVLGGFVLFFALEALIRGGRCHRAIGNGDSVVGPLVLLGDALHNFVDGVLIAGAFLTALPLGIATSVAVLAHELPQELGDIAVLLDEGYSATRAVTLNTVASLATPLGGLLAYLALESVTAAVPYLVAIAAASFMYIAAADLIPGLHRRTAPAAVVGQLALILCGIATIVAVEAMHR